MASLVQHTPGAPTVIPLTQNTAPVIEFRCLFTSDIRRKQKRWQDGRLKFHTFNKRVMVYDERLNFVGDTHWHDYHIDEGEELELDRAAVLVQVADCLGSRDQDLTELLDKRTKQREERAAVRRPSSSPAEVPLDNRGARQPTPYSKLSQKPLSALLGTPTGRHGRALLPTTSPFEDRQKKLRQERGTEERPSKRRKSELTCSKAGYAQNLTGAMLDLSSTPHSTAPLRREPLWSRTSRRQEGDANSKEESHRMDLLSREFQEPPRQERRQWQPPEKKAKSGFAQTLTGAVLDLSSTQNTNAFMRHHLPSTPNIERGPSAENHPERGRHQQSRNETVQANVLQPPVVGTQRTNQIKAKKNARSRNKSPTGDSSVTTAKGGQAIPSGVQQQDCVGTSDEFPAIDDDFIDIDDIEQSSRPRNSPKISNSNDARKGTSDLPAIAISPSPRVPPPEESERSDTITPVVMPKSAQDVTIGPSETVGSIRLKSRPKRKMLLLNDSRQAQSPSIQAIPRPISPGEDIAPEQSQATKKLDDFHAQQKKQLRARAVKRKASVEQGDDGTSEADSASEGNRGLAGKATSALPSKQGTSVPKAPTDSLPRQSQSERIVQQSHPTAVERPVPLPTKGTASRPSRRSPEPVPQSSEPAFEQLRSVADRIASGEGVALQTTSFKPYVPMIPETTAEVKTPLTKTADVKAPRTRSGRRRSEESPTAANTQIGRAHV